PNQPDEFGLESLRVGRFVQPYDWSFFLSANRRSFHSTPELFALRLHEIYQSAREVDSTSYWKSSARREPPGWNSHQPLGKNSRNSRPICLASTTGNGIARFFA